MCLPKKYILSFFLVIILATCCVTSSDSVYDRNIYGNDLELCSDNPKTGYTRSGYCVVMRSDLGNHAVCAQVTNEFLNYTKSMGNDLTRASPQYGFPGLKHGDRWCLCAVRWKQAELVNKAPFVLLDATNKASLNNVALTDLEKYGVKRTKSEL